MSLVTLNSQRVTEATVVLPMTGVWHARAALDGAGVAAGARATLKTEGLELAGVAFRPGVFRERAATQVIGGVGGMSKVVPARSYRSPTVAILLKDLERETGETLAATITDAIKLRTFDRWTRLEGPAAHALDLLCAEIGATWRILEDGKLWVGVDTWTEVKFDHQLLEDSPSDRRMTIASELPLLRPGVTFNGHRVERVEHAFSASSVRTTAWYRSASAEPSGGRLWRALRSLVGLAVRELRYLGHYDATVVGQSGNAVELKTDSPIVPEDVLVPIKLGLPGVEVTVPNGARCTIAFANGDPKKPYVVSWEPDALTEMRFDNGSRPIARVDDTITAGTLGWISPGAGLVVLTWTPPGGATVQLFQLSVSAGALTLTPLGAPPLTSIELTGKVTSGAAKVKG